LLHIFYKINTFVLPHVGMCTVKESGYLTVARPTVLNILRINKYPSRKMYLTECTRKQPNVSDFRFVVLLSSTYLFILDVEGVSALINPLKTKCICFI
jgi:hypothetical protein